MGRQSRALRRQRRSGYVLLAGAVGIESLLVALVLSGTAPAILPVFAGVPALIAGYFGTRALLAAQSGTILLDERDAYPHWKAGQTAFWALLSAIMLDDLFGLFPRRTPPRVLHLRRWRDATRRAGVPEVSRHDAV